MQKYAIFETGAKQYRVQEGDVIDVELLGSDEEARVEFPVLFMGKDGQPLVGAPHVKGCKVVTKVIDPKVKGKKLIAFKFKRRKSCHKKIGHRQKSTRLKVEEIIAA